MIEVVTSPAHLAGATVAHIRVDEVDGTSAMIVDHPTEGRVHVVASGVATMFLMPDEIDTVRSLIGESKDASTVADAFAAVVPVAEDVK